jgi:hypothetical protein
MVNKENWDWTVSRVEGESFGRSNSSSRFVELSAAVEAIIRQSAFDLIGGRADRVAGLIMAQLAHKHGLAPRGTVVSPNAAFGYVVALDHILPMIEVKDAWLGGQVAVLKELQQKLRGEK